MRKDWFRPMKRLAHFFCIVLLVIISTGVLASEVIIVASPYPKEVLIAYKRAFDESNPQYRVEFVNVPGTNIIPFLIDRSSGSRPDVFWGSSPDAFRAMLRRGLLQPIENLGNLNIPAKIGSLNIDDAEQFYKGQALSGYGIMWNTRYVKARAITPPRTWSDLVKPEYFGHVVMSSPSRSSTTHLIVESILQGAGWDEGWSVILQIAGNCAKISDRSFGVPNSITSGRFGVGLVVDFLALSGKYSGFPVDFVYAWPNVITPASIGLVAGARNSEGGRKFINFTLSKEGQSLLLRPEISRMPVLPEIYEATDRSVDYANLIDVINKYPPSYDPDVSEARYQVVNAIFDQVVTFRHSELVDATKAIHAAQRLLIKRPHAEAGALIVKARNLIYRAPVSELDELTTHSQLQTRAQITEIAVREAEWARQTRKNYEIAKNLAEQASALMK